MRRRFCSFLTLALVAAAVTYQQLTSEIRETLLGWFASDEVIFRQSAATPKNFDPLANSGERKTSDPERAKRRISRGHVSDIRFKRESGMEGGYNRAPPKRIDRNQRQSWRGRLGRCEWTEPGQAE
jgi:hypothetical protein